MTSESWAEGSGSTWADIPRACAAGAAGVLAVLARVLGVQSCDLETACARIESMRRDRSAAADGLRYAADDIEQGKHLAPEAAR